MRAEKASIPQEGFLDKRPVAGKVDLRIPNMVHVIAGTLEHPFVTGDQTVVSMVLHLEMGENVGGESAERTNLKNWGIAGELAQGQLDQVQVTSFEHACIGHREPIDELVAEFDLRHRRIDLKGYFLKRPCKEMPNAGHVGYFTPNCGVVKLRHH